MTNYGDTVSLTTNNESRSLDWEQGRHLASVAVSTSNKHFYFSLITSLSKIDFRTYFINPFSSLYYSIFRIYVCTFSRYKCACDCKCEPNCKGNTICLCLCNFTGAETTNTFCLCICKKKEKNCICICICNDKNCKTGTQHTCKDCLIKINIGSLNYKSSTILGHLILIGSYIPRIERKCCPCSCCLFICCGGSCCGKCKSLINEYKSIISKIESVESNFKEMLYEIPQVRTFKIILSFYATIGRKCPKCPDHFKQISMLITDIEKFFQYYWLFGSRIYKLKYIGWIRKSLRQNLVNLLKHYINYVSLDKYTNYYFIISFTYYSINEFRGSIFLYKELLFYYEIPEILLKGTTNCCCICSYKICNKNDNVPNNYNGSLDNQIQTYVRWMTENHGNHLCLCLISNYVFTRCIRLYMCYLRDIEMDIISVINRFYYKYTHSTTHMMSIGKLIMLIISIIYRITRWMKYNYLCTCPQDCPCLKNGKCSSGCPVCSLPPVKCCECPKKLPANCKTSGNANGRNNNDSCKCKCKNKDGTSCCKCNSGGCKQDKCCRCCCNCFCKNVNDPYYQYLVSTILWISSLIENIWAIDNQAIVTAIQSLSSLYSELTSYDFNSINDKRTVSCSKVCSLIVNKQCKKAENKCCWCVTIINILVACVSICVQFRIYKAITKKDDNKLCTQIKDFCQIKECKGTCTDKEKCCLLKIALSSELCNSEKLKQLLEDCCKECTPEETCCKTIIDKVKSGQADLLVIGCKCDSEEATEVKAQCVLFNNPCRPVAVVIACKCQDDPKCCCLKNVIENLKDKLKDLCKNCQCKDLTGILDKICTSSCCGGKCPCKELKEELKKICKGNNSQCLCKEIEKLGTLCAKPDCQCKKEGCCRCVCCKVLIAGVKVLTRACRQNFLEPYKRITLDLISTSTDNHVKILILDSINSGREKQTFLVKNNYTTHFNTYSDHKNIANSFPSLTVGYGYGSVYDHEEANNSDYTGINGIREGYSNRRSGRIIKRNKLKPKERANVYTLEYLHTRAKTPNNIKK